MKKIAYLIINNGIDGMGDTSVDEAYWEENQRDASFDKNPNKNYFSKTEVIVNVEVDTKQALNKLNGLERLLLGLKKEELTTKR